MSIITRVYRVDVYRRGWVKISGCSGRFSVRLFECVYAGQRDTRMASRVCLECVHEGVSYGSSHAKLRRGCACYRGILLIPNCVTVIATLLFGGEKQRYSWNVEMKRGNVSYMFRYIRIS